MKNRIIVLLCVLFMVSAYSEATVFKIINGNRYCYIGGTVHVLAESNYPLPEEYDRAYSDSEILVIETDAAALAQPENVRILMEKGMYSDGITIKDKLSPKVYKKLERTLSGIGIPVKGAQQLKPGILSSIITAIQFQKMGYTAEGVESFYLKKAVEDNRDVLFLEALEEQLDFLTGMGEGNEDEFILSVLQDLDKTQEYIHAMISSWEFGESFVIEKSAKEMRETFPEIYKTLLTDRNSAWIDVLKQYLTNDAVEFVLFGAMHLYGEDGVLELLRNEGFIVEQLR